MSDVRTGIFEFRGQDAPVVGAGLKVGQQAPEFSAHNKEWQVVNALESTQNKVRVIGSLPDTMKKSDDEPNYEQVNAAARAALGMGR